MDYEKYDSFKDLGEVEKTQQWEIVNFTKNIQVFYNFLTDKMHVFKTSEVNGKKIVTICFEDGKYEISLSGFYFYVIEYKEGLYHIESFPENIEKCIQNGIILSEERIYGYSTPFPVYAVKFNDLFDPSFKELPDNVKKYFEKLQNIDDMEF